MRRRRSALINAVIKQVSSEFCAGWHYLWLVLTTRFDPKLVKIIIIRHKAA